MENEKMKICPYCRETIRAEAIKCRYCGSMLTGKPASSGYWYRVNEGKKIAGVCTGIAREFNSEKLILPLRLFLVLSTILSGFGLIVYIVLWVIMPAPVDHPVEMYKSKREDGSVSESHEPVEIPTGKTTGSHNTALGLIFVLMGSFVIFWLFARGHGISLPFIGHFHIPHFWPAFGPGFLFRWTPGILTLLVIAGLFIVVLGGLRFFRFLFGCGLLFFGAILIFLFFGFMPSIALFPVALIIGCVLILLGGVMFVAGLMRD